MYISTTGAPEEVDADIGVNLMSRQWITWLMGLMGIVVVALVARPATFTLMMFG